MTDRTKDDVACPFCGTDDFDLIGLKIHLSNGWCDEYEAIDGRTSLQREQDFRDHVAAMPGADGERVK